MKPPNAISLRDLAFVRDVLIPRAWVRGAEVDDLVRLRATIEGILATLGPSAPGTPDLPAEPQPRQGKKPRHPKPGRKTSPSAEEA